MFTCWCWSKSIGGALPFSIFTFLFQGKIYSLFTNAVICRNNSHKRLTTDYTDSIPYILWHVCMTKCGWHYIVWRAKTSFRRLRNDTATAADCTSTTGHCCCAAYGWIARAGQKISAIWSSKCRGKCENAWTMKKVSIKVFALFIVSISCWILRQVIT